MSWALSRALYICLKVASPCGLLKVLLWAKGRNLTQSYDKISYIYRKLQKAKWQNKYATKNFDYIKIANRLRTVSCSDDSNATGVVMIVYGIPTFPLTENA